MISPHDINALTADESDDNSEDGDFSPSPAYKASHMTTQQPRRKDIKIVLDSSSFFFFRPLTFDKDRFWRGHPQVYSTADIVAFDMNYQKQLSFNFSATHASWKKSAVMDNARASLLCDVDLNVTPSWFSWDTTAKHSQRLTVVSSWLSYHRMCLIGCTRQPNCSILFGSGKVYCFKPKWTRHRNRIVEDVWGDVPCIAG